MSGKDYVVTNWCHQSSRSDTYFYYVDNNECPAPTKCCQVFISSLKYNMPRSACGPADFCKAQDDKMTWIIVVFVIVLAFIVIFEIFRRNKKMKAAKAAIAEEK